MVSSSAPWYPALQAQLESSPERAPLRPPLRLLAAVLHLVPLSAWLPPVARRGRRPHSRQALAAAFLAKALLNLPTTRALRTYLALDAALRTLCGFPSERLPSEATFSRAFAQFAAKDLPAHWHAALVRATQRSRLLGHIARDSTAIVAREYFPVPPRARTKKPKRKPGRPKRATAPARLTRLQRQRTQTLAQMKRELPTSCGLGVKTHASGYHHYWRGDKLHLDVVDGQIPVSALLTSAHVNDSQVAIPLMTMSAERGLSWCYEVMDTAYDCDLILTHCRAQGHVPIVPPHPRRTGRSRSQLPKVFTGKPGPEMGRAEAVRYRERTMVERVFARLKEEFGGRHIRVRGAAKVQAHLLMGVIVLAVDQMLRWAATAPSSTTLTASATCG